MEISTAGDAELCPIDGRRSTNEVWMKLFVVYFTTTVALCHLQSIRGEQILGPRLLVHILLPLGRLCDLALSLAVITPFITYWTISRNQNLGRRIAEVLLLVFGRYSPKRRSASGPLMPAPEASDGNDSHIRRQGSWRKMNAIKIGRLVFVLVLLAQCVGSIIIYERRAKHDAALFTDQLVFDLACGGILTAALTAAFLLRTPCFVKPVPPDLHTPSTRFIAFFVRPEYNSNIVITTILVVMRGGVFAMLLKARSELAEYAASIMDMFHFHPQQLNPSSQRDLYILFGILLVFILLQLQLGQHLDGRSLRNQERQDLRRSAFGKCALVRKIAAKDGQFTRLIFIYPFFSFLTSPSSLYSLSIIILRDGFIALALAYKWSKDLLEHLHHDQHSLSRR
ncbi:uncharacterized protein FTOL_10285 [Fusarium torulosum]|uniref:Uncharacterized protein n=1 Tax=Fusarium torulosum TaxID=33205 RepID=A0AAE8SLR8_9HYPO|nr:uncharacterized protein FTOL_10285 [Fusarium torulosum]